MSVIVGCDVCGEVVRRDGYARVEMVFRDRGEHGGYTLCEEHATQLLEWLREQRAVAVEEGADGP